MSSGVDREQVGGLFKAKVSERVAGSCLVWGSAQ